MARWNRERLMRAGLAVALLAGVLAATFGAGYRTSHALLDSASAYVQRGNSVVRVNAESRDTDAQAQAARRLARGHQRLEIVQISPGVVYIVNNETGEVWRLPTDTMLPKEVDGLPTSAGGGRNGLRVVAGGGRAYLLDKQRGTLTLLEGPEGRARTQVPLPKPVSDAVVDSSGTAWALSQQVGELYSVANGPAVAHRVAAPWEPMWLTLAGDRPVVYLPRRGVAAMFDRKGEAGKVDLPEEKTAAGIQVSAPGADSRVLVATSRTEGELVKADFSSGGKQRTQLAGRAGHDFGSPVVSRGRVYVPDYTDRHVVVLELGSLRQVDRVAVPGATYFQLFARDGRVWVNDPYHRYMLSFDRNGHRTQIDKNRGAGAQQEPDQPAPPRPDQEVSEQPEENVRRVRVPDVIGSQRAGAESEVEQRDLVFRAVTREGGCQTGRVLETDPGAGTLVRAGSAVAVVVCGPAEVPNLAGMTIEQAHRALQQARLTWQDSAEGVIRTPADVGKVVRQDPAPASRLSTNGVVTIGYLDPQQGSRIAVPSLVGMSNEQACQTLQAMFLGCSGTPVPHPQAAGVHGQDPVANAEVISGTPIRYNYQVASPVPLNRYKADRSESRYLSLAGAPAGDGVWAPQPPIARVYPATAIGAVPGLVGIVQAGCTDCDDQVLYFYALNAGRPAKPDGKWSTPAAPVFACFDPASAPPGTIPLQRMYNDTGKGRRWAFAPEPSGEFTFHKDRAYVTDKTLCNLWPR